MLATEMVSTKLLVARAASRLSASTVTTTLTDAAAIRDTADGIHYAGSVLAPFANRVANGSYSFFGRRHFLPRNECPSSRCDALHLQVCVRKYPCP